MPKAKEPEQKPNKVELMVFDYLKQGLSVETIRKKTKIKRTRILIIKKDYDLQEKAKTIRGQVLDHLSVEFSNQARKCCLLSMKIMDSIDALIDAVNKSGTVTQDQKDQLSFLDSALQSLNKSAKLMTNINPDLRDGAIQKIFTQIEVSAE